MTLLPPSDPEIRAEVREVLERLEGNALHQVREVALRLARGGPVREETLDAGYRAMAADEAREREASEWVEATFNDGDL